jgi:uncharacterized protein (TIGR00369 family)
VADAAPPLAFVPRIPFVDLLGFELRQFDGGISELAFDPRPEHLNTFDVVHGGVTLSLMDVAMAVAARSVQKDVGVVTIELKTSFLQSATGRLTARGQLLHRTRTMAFAEARVLDAQGRLCAHATGTFKYRARTSPPPAGGDAGAGIATD